MKPVEIIYLSCPFRHADPMVQKIRSAAAHYAAAQLSAKGHHVFSPLTHQEALGPIVPNKVPPEHWIKFGLAVLRHCKHLYILKMDGWELSRGVQREIRFAREHQISIQEIDPPHESVYLPFLKEFP